MLRLIKKKQQQRYSQFFCFEKCVSCRNVCFCFPLCDSAHCHRLPFSMVPVACPQSGNPRERWVWGGAGETISPVFWIWTTVMGIVVGILNIEETVSPNPTSSCQYYSTYCTFKATGGILYQKKTHQHKKAFLQTVFHREACFSPVCDQQG